MPTRALLLVLAGAAVLVVLFAILRPDDDEAEPTEARPATTQVETGTETEAETETETAPDVEPAPPPGPVVQTVAVRVRDGRVVGGVARPTFRRGERIRLVVRADVSDHVHLHGYDIMRDVAPGRPAQIGFDATLTGRFEVELEDRGLHIAEIEIQP